MKKLYYILFISLFVINLSQAQWTQIGNNVEGEISGDEFGGSVSISSNGKIIAVGAPSMYSGVTNGYVKVFEFINDNWVQLGNKINGTSSNSYFGYSVSLNSDGTILAIGDPNASNLGQVSIYEYNNGNWIQKGNTIINSVNGRFGHRVCLNDEGNIVAISSYWSPWSNGHVEVLKFDNGNWVQMGTNITSSLFGTGFGVSISLNSDGKTLAVGCPYHPGDANGYVNIFHFNDSIWELKGNTINGVSNQEHFGAEVSINSDGNIVAIAVPGSSNTRIFEYISGNWQKIGNDINYSINDGCIECVQYGTALCIDSVGGILVIRNRVYKNIFDNWTIINNEMTGDNISDGFGTSASLSSDGSFVVIGANENIYKTNNSGYAKVFYNCSLDSSVTGTSITQNGNTLITNLAGATYQWVNCDSSFTEIIGETSQSFTPASNGSFAVIIRDNYCPDTSSCYTFTSIDEIENNYGISIYPNPTTGLITIQAEGIESIEVYNLQGQIICKKTEARSTKFDLDLSSQPKGIYILKVQTSRGVAVEKVVLE